MRNRYIFDFVKAYGQYLKNVEVIFPLDDVESIELDGKRQRAYCGHVWESGKSSDGLYYRVHLSDYTFWVDPSDYRALMNFLSDRQEKALEIVRENQKQRLEHEAILLKQLAAGVKSDEISDDIYKCFIYKAPDNDLAKQFETLTSAIEKKCLEHGGRLYKSKAKSAKYAIIASYYNYTTDNFDSFRQAGYRVVTLEDAAAYMGLQEFWNASEIQQRLKSYIQDCEHTLSIHKSSCPTSSTTKTKASGCGSTLLLCFLFILAMILLLS